MEYLQSIGGQVTLFLRSLGFGALLGILYEAVRLLRLFVGKKGFQVFWDVLFGVSAAFCTFLYDLVYSDGKLRLFVFTAQCAGFAVWYVMAVPAVRQVSERCLERLRRVSFAIRRPFVRLEQRCVSQSRKTGERIKFFMKKCKKNKKTS